MFEGMNSKTKKMVIGNIERNLDNVSLYGGHTLLRHVQTEEGLKMRMKEWNMNKVSSFYSETIAEKAVVALMRYKFRDIANWLSFGNEELTLIAKCKKPLGFGFIAGDETRHESSVAHVVLVKDETADWGFTIKTAYLDL